MSDEADPKPARPPLGTRLDLTASDTGRRMSEILRDIAAETGPDRITVADLLTAMEGRAFGALLLLFAFPNILPSPPGLAAILGLPLIYLASQLMLGRSPWLPNFIANRSISRVSFASVIVRATPWIARAERMLVTRLHILAGPVAQRLLGAVCLLLSLILVLPIPFGNMLPSLAICIIALGMLERDGAWILGGLVSAVVAAGVVGGLAYGLVKSAIFVLMNAF
jgi:hypothetical protein